MNEIKGPLNSLNNIAIIPIIIDAGKNIFRSTIDNIITPIEDNSY